MNKLLLTAAVLTAVLGAAGCSTDASVASHNLSKAADNFEILRRVVFYNGITGDYMLSIEGFCSLDASGGTKVAITCKTGAGQYKKHFLGLSDNVTYFIEQVDGAAASTAHYRVVFKPSVILPNIDVR